MPAVRPTLFFALWILGYVAVSLLVLGLTGGFTPQFKQVMYYANIPAALVTMLFAGWLATVLPCIKVKIEPFEV